MATIRDIARLSGYSIGTVSRVLNHHTDVSDAARAKIEKVIAEQGFQPNSNAASLKRTHQSSILILVKGTQNAFLENILEKIQVVLKDNSEDSMVSFLNETDDEVRFAIQSCHELKPKGIIFLGGNPACFRTEFGEITIPCVLVGENASDYGFDNLSSCYTDDEQAARSAVEYLIRQGHTKIGIVGGSSDKSKGELGPRRLKGAEKAMEEKNIPFDEASCFAPSLFSIHAGYEAAKELLQRRPEITAVYAMSDIIAIGTERAASDLGRRVPEDLSIIGYDGIDLTRYTVPRLATVKQDTDELARVSTEDLLRRLYSPKKKAEHVSVQFHVLTGESIQKI